MLLKKIKEYFTDYSIVVFLVIVINAFIRLAEFLYLNVVKVQEIPLHVLYEHSIQTDTFFIILFSLVGIAPFSLFYLISVNVAKFIVRLTAFLYILVLLLLTGYFLINNSLLSIAIFDFSISDVFNIIYSELSKNRLTPIVSGIVFLLITVFILNKSKNWNHARYIYTLPLLYLFLVLVGLINRDKVFKPLAFFDNSYHYLIGNSKPAFLLYTYAEDLNIDYDYSNKQLAESIKTFSVLYPKKKCYSNKYPLLNNSSYDNVLGEYFSETASKPNIVFIVSESLSASFSGDSRSIKYSLTPFLDSIKTHGLSWNNFFSNAERSYGVLPNLLASLPSGIGARGFINMDQDTTYSQRFPKHCSLIQILRDNGYYTSYFYGGSGSFDNVSMYMHQNNIHNCFTMDEFDTIKYPMNLYVRSKQAWGHKDGSMYNQGLDVMDTIKAPYFSIFQTLSNHSPYNLSDDQYYSEPYISSKLKGLNMTMKDVQKIDKTILSSIFYADDALRDFFYRIKKRDDFENTIFLITGDHAVDLNLADNVFENYHVPLVIYSPLLKKGKVFNGVCSHIDVLPSLLSLLENNYQLTIPKQNHWLGSGLSNSEKFESERVVPLNIKSIDMPSFIINDHVFMGNYVFQFNENLETQIINDSLKIKDFKNKFEAYKTINRYVCSKNLIQK